MRKTLVWGPHLRNRRPTRNTGQRKAFMADVKTSRFATLFRAAQKTPLTVLAKARQRGEGFYFPIGPLGVDFAWTHLSAAMLTSAPAALRLAGWPEAFEAMCAGQVVNTTEERPVLHCALRMSDSERRAVLPAALAEEFIMADGALSACVEDFHAGRVLTQKGRPFSAILHIGIGGGALGPHLVLDALDHLAPEGAIPVRFCANVDPAAFDRAVAGLDPAKTLIIYASKSWTTRESRLNLDRALAWIAAAGIKDPRHHVVAVTSKPEAAQAWGARFVLPQPESVGGRYSVLSSVGLAIALRLGWSVFTALRDGAHSVDTHMRALKPTQNPVLLAALVGWGYASLWRRRTRAVFAYEDRLRLLVPYLQQLELESLGKGVDLNGRAVGVAAPILWGGVGTTDQHSVFQLLHQAGEWAPIDFILVRDFHTMAADAHRHQARRALYANGLAQAASLALGRTRQAAQEDLRASGVDAATAQQRAPHKSFPGNRPSVLIEMADLTPHSLGALIAFYEHRTFVQGLLWGVNPFDQMGVELGKIQAVAVEAALAEGGDQADLDPITRARVARAVS